MNTTEKPAVSAHELFFGENLWILQSAEESFNQIIRQLKKRYAARSMRFPVEHYKTRIKPADSTKAKLAKLDLPQTFEAATDYLFDLVGARVVCQFIDDIYELKNMLENIEGIEITQIKDYIQSPKPNGYRSLHIILRLPVQTADGIIGQSVEIQIRTIAMDFWASLEHELKYKKNIPDAELMFRELKRCSEEIASLDLSMQTIYEWLQK